MFRTAVFAICLVAAQGTAQLYGATTNSNAYCYAYYMQGGQKDWCWLTSNGKQTFNKDRNPYACKSFEGYSAHDWCEKDSTGQVKLHNSQRDSGASGILLILEGLRGARKVNCQAVCGFYGYQRYSRSYSWKSDSSYRPVRDTTCTCGNSEKKVYLRCSGLPFTVCTLQSATGRPAPVPAPSPPAPSATPKPPATSGKAPAASGMGNFIAKFAEGKKGEHVGSAATGHRQTECWDLAMAAIEASRAAGYSIPNAPSSYVWSTKTVDYKQALPGDIAQFVSWNEKITFPSGGWSTRSTGPRHTAVVTAAFNSADCGLEMYDQNPSAVHRSVYHPCPGKKLGGSLILYRLSVSGRLYTTDEQWPVPAEFANSPMGSPTLPWIACALVTVSVAFGAWRMKLSRHKFHSMQLLATTTEEEDQEMPEPLAME